MTALLIVLAAIVLLFTGYVFYGSWLAKQWGIDPTKKTPAIEKEDGVDYVAAKPAVLMGHHFPLSPEQADQRTDPGFHLRMGSRIPVVYYRWYFLRRSAGLRIFIRIYQT